MFGLQFFDSVFNLSKTLVKMFITELNAFSILLLELIYSI